MAHLNMVIIGHGVCKCIRASQYDVHLSILITHSGPLSESALKRVPAGTRHWPGETSQPGQANTWTNTFTPVGTSQLPLRMAALVCRQWRESGPPAGAPKEYFQTYKASRTAASKKLKYLDWFNTPLLSFLAESSCKLTFEPNGF